MGKEQFPFCKKETIDKLIFELSVDREQMLLWLAASNKSELDFARRI